jgi:hypothetical protein
VGPVQTAAEGPDQTAVPRNRRKTRKGLTEVGETAAQIVIEAQKGSRVLRKLTYVIVLLTLINTGFVIYSALK